MRRLAIINHDDHTLFVESVSEDELDGKYGGDEQEYINANYPLLENYSWDWITDAEYIGVGQSMPVEIDFDELEECYEE